MPPPKTITIVGGGLAGLTLGIGLRQRDVPVMLCEAARYPRHRVCGEFISGEGQRVLERLNLFGALVSAGARAAHTIAAFTNRSASRGMTLPASALCLSRFTLDELLAQRFSNLGGELILNRRWLGPASEGVVLATGRRPRPIVDGWRWFGLKAHAHDVVLRTDLEMHFDRDGYVGLCRLAHGEINVCGLFRTRKPLHDLAQRWRELLRGADGSQRRERLRNAAFDESSFCSVSGLSLAPQCENARTECRIGDALTMIPPVTGNGMSMAFESAESAIAPLQAYSRGEASWVETQASIAQACSAKFERRLAWAALLQRGLLEPRISRSLVFLATRCPCLLRVLFLKTR